MNLKKNKPHNEPLTSAVNYEPYYGIHKATKELKTLGNLEKYVGDSTFIKTRNDNPELRERINKQINSRFIALKEDPKRSQIRQTLRNMYNKHPKLRNASKASKGISI